MIKNSAKAFKFLFKKAFEFLSEDREFQLDKLKNQGIKNALKEFKMIKNPKKSLEFLSKNARFKLDKLKRHGISIDLEMANTLLNFKQEVCRNAHDEPMLDHISSQLCTASQFKSDIYTDWCHELGEAPRFHRKQWEFVYILEALKSFNMLTSGKRGLGFGCGKEPLPALMAKYGCEVLATDLDKDLAIEYGWSASNQHAAKVEDLFRSNICSKDVFLKHVQYRNVNMNNVPQDLTEFDFVWSSCAFEHLGSIEKGLNFVLNSIKCLRKGGVAIHTTEYNLSSNDDTFESESLVFFRKRDIEKLIKALEASGCEVSPLNLTIGERVEDGFVDLPPFKSEPHLKLALFGYLTTSIGLIIKRL